MGGKDDKDRDSAGFPDEIFRQMQQEHERFMRDLAKAKQQTTPSSPPPQRGFFIDFKNFIDESLKSLSDNMRNLPSNISELNTRMLEERAARKEEEIAVSRRWTGLDDSPDHIALRSERLSTEDMNDAISAALLLLRENRERNKSVSREKIDALYQDYHGPRLHPYFSGAPMLSFGGACYYQSDDGYNAPSTNIWRWGTPQYRWLSIGMSNLITLRCALNT
jgi:hypothetical protein